MINKEKIDYLNTLDEEQKKLYLMGYLDGLTEAMKEEINYLKERNRE